jgi:glycosyltransferase involved in cell wall biosynthesis
MKKFLIREGVQDEKIVVIPNGIDPEKFHPGVSGRTVRESYSLNGKLVIGFVGWFRKWHGLEMLLELMHKAGLAEKNIGLLLVGDGPAYPELDRYVKQHNLESSVIFTGPIKREEIPAHIAAIDIAVQPSATEYACPIKIVEYMGMAKCIVAPDQANIREIIEDGVEAFLFKPGDKESLRSTLLNLLDNPARQKESGQRAHKAIFERKFLWRANAEKALNLVSGKEFSHE